MGPVYSVEGSKELSFFSRSKEPTHLEASPCPGQGLAVCPLQRYVQCIAYVQCIRVAGPHRPHLPGFIIWTSLPYWHGSFLLNRLTLSHDNQNGHLPPSVRSWPSIELRGCTDLFGMITQGWVDLDDFDPLTFCRDSLYNTWSLWAPLGV